MCHADCNAELRGTALMPIALHAKYSHPEVFCWDEGRFLIVQGRDTRFALTLQY